MTVRRMHQQDVLADDLQSEALVQAFGRECELGLGGIVRKCMPDGPQLSTPRADHQSTVGQEVHSAHLEYLPLGVWKVLHRPVVGLDRLGHDGEGQENRMHQFISFSIDAVASLQLDRKMVVSSTVADASFPNEMRRPVPGS